MVELLLTVRDFRTELSGEVVDTGELLRNYEFNISQGIIQRMSRFFETTHWRSWASAGRSRPRAARAPTQHGVASWASATSATSATRRSPRTQ